MADTPATFGNDLFRQFLIERGYQQTLKTFENEIKDEKKRGIRVSAVVERLRHAVLASDLQQMQETWRFLEASIFKWLEAGKMQAATTFRHELYRWYLVAAAQNRRADKVLEFFDQLAPELQRCPEWSDWFAFPYTKAPQDNPKFAMYFQRTWVELYQLSLKNFLMLALNSSAYPQVVQQLAAMLRHMQHLDAENKALRKKLAEGGQEVPEQGVLSPVEPREARALLREKLDDIDEDFSNVREQEESAKPDPKPAGAAGAAPGDGRAAPAARGGIVSSVMRKFSKAPAPAAGGGRRGRVAPVLGNRLTGRESDEEEAEWALHRGLGIARQLTFTEHRSMINHCRLSPAGGVAASLELEGVVKLWSVSAAALGPVATLTARGAFLGLDWVAGSRAGEERLLLSTKTGQVRLYDLAQRATVREAAATAESNPHPRLHLVRSAPGGTKFLLGAISPPAPARGPDTPPAARRGRLAVWDLTTLRPEGELTVGPDDAAAANACAVTAEDGLVVAACADGAVRAYDLHRWALVKSVAAHPTGEALAVMLAPDARSCFSLGTDGRLAAWTLPDLRPLGASLPSLHAGVAGPFELIRTGGYKQVLHVPRGQIASLGPDGRSLLTCAGPAVKIYDINRSTAEGAQGISCGHRAPVVSLDWHWSNGNIVVLSACMEGSIVASFLTHSP